MAVDRKVILMKVYMFPIILLLFGVSFSICSSKQSERLRRTVNPMQVKAIGQAHI